jgi:hypothetical protein
MAILAGFIAVCLWGTHHLGQSGGMLRLLDVQATPVDGPLAASAVPPVPSVPAAPALPVVPLVPPPPPTIASDPPAPANVRPAIVDASLPPIVMPPDVSPASADSPKPSPPSNATAAPQGSLPPVQSPAPALPPLPPVPPPGNFGPAPAPVRPPSTPAPWPKLPAVPPPESNLSSLPKPGNTGNPSSDPKGIGKSRPVSPPLAPLEQVPVPSQAAPILGSPLPAPQSQKSALPVPSATGPSQTAPGVSAPPVSSAQVPPAGASRYVLLKNNKLIIGSVRLEGDEVVVRQGALDRRWPKGEVIAIVEDAQAVWQTLRKPIPDADVPARLALARWLMFQGMREQALAEARAIVEYDPHQKQAQDLVRSLELSLQQFPSSGQASPSGARGQMLADWSQELQLTTQGILSFANQAQPVLANQCMDCHARSDYSGPFRLARASGLEVGWQHTWQNLRAVAAQLDRQEPAQSPLLRQALSAHGGMKQPAFLSRQASGYKALEAWVLAAIPPPAPTAIPPARSEEAPPPPPAIPPAKTEDTPVSPPRLPPLPSPATPPDSSSAPAGPLPAVPPPLPSPATPPSGSTTPSISVPPVPPPALPQAPSPTPAPQGMSSLPPPPLPAVPPPPVPSAGPGALPPPADEFDPAPFHTPPSPPRR